MFVSYYLLPHIYLLSVAPCLPIIICCPMFAYHYLLPHIYLISVAPCLPIIICCPMFIYHYLLPHVYLSLSVAPYLTYHYLLPHVYLSLSVAPYLSIIIYCPMFQSINQTVYNVLFFFYSKCFRMNSSTYDLAHAVVCTHHT